MSKIYLKIGPVIVFIVVLFFILIITFISFNIERLKAKGIRTEAFVISSEDTYCSSGRTLSKCNKTEFSFIDNSGILRQESATTENHYEPGEKLAIKYLDSNLILSLKPESELAGLQSHFYICISILIVFLVISLYLYMSPKKKKLARKAEASENESNHD